jgi:adenylate cyclase
VRVNAQLIDAETGAHLSAEQFDADQSDLLEMQDEIVTRIARGMGFQLVAADVGHAARTRSGNLETDDLALRCLAASIKPETWGAGVSLCQQALQVDDRNVRAMFVVSLSYSMPVIDAQSIDRAGDLEKADELASRALAVDPDNNLAHLAKALVLIGQMRTDNAVAELERSVALNPSFVDAYTWLAISYNFLGQPDRAVEFVDKAIRLSPRDPWMAQYYHVKGWALFMKQQYGPAIEWLRRVGSGSRFTELLLASAYSLTGEQAEAHDALQRYLALPGVATKSITQLKAQQLALANNPTWVAYNERLFTGLRKAGMPEE